MNILNLEMVYDNNAMFYWCNGCGEINMPGDGQALCAHKPEELPEIQRNLYENYWREDQTAMYVVNLNGIVGMAITALIDMSYCEDIMGSVGKQELDDMYGMLQDEASEIAANPKFSKCTLLLGKETDPCGDELVMFIPHDIVPELLDDAVTRMNGIYAGIEKRTKNLTPPFEFAQKIVNALQKLLDDMGYQGEYGDDVSITLDKGCRLKNVTFLGDEQDLIICDNTGAYGSPDGSTITEYNGFASLIN